MAAYDLFRKSKSLYSSTANSFGSGTGETITPSSVAGLPTDTDITLTFDRGVAGKVERIIGSISGGNFVINSSPTGRGADSTSDQAHTSPTVEMVWNAADWNDLIDGILAEHTQTGAHDNTVLAYLAGNQTFTGVKTFGSGKLKVTDITVGSYTVTPPSATDTLVGRATTDTLTNKRTQPRIVSAASYTTDTGTSLSVATADIFVITAQAGALKFNNPGGTPVQGEKLIIRIKDDGTARALTYDTQFRAMGTALPSTTVLGKTLYLGFIFNSTDTKWDLLAAAQEA